MLGHRRVVDAGSEQERDAELGAALDVDLVDADAVLRQHLEPRSGLLQHGPRDRVVAADVAVHRADGRERVGLVERPAGCDHLPAGGGQGVVVSAGRVLERGGGQQDAGLHDRFQAGRRGNPRNYRPSQKTSITPPRPAPPAGRSATPPLPGRTPGAALRAGRSTATDGSRGDRRLPHRRCRHDAASRPRPVRADVGRTRHAAAPAPAS